MSVHLVILFSYVSLNCLPTHTDDQPDQFLPLSPSSTPLQLTVSVSSELMSGQKTEQQCELDFKTIMSPWSICELNLGAYSWSVGLSYFKTLGCIFK